MVLAACGQATEAAPVTGGQTERPAPGLNRVAQPRYAPTDFQAGAMVLVYGNDPAFAAKSAALLDRLARLGVNSVGFVFPIFQRGPTATDVYADETTPTDANFNTFLAQAHRRGFTVMVRPLLDEQSAAFSGYWRGNIKPADRAAWWRSYNHLILKYAELGQADGATIFDVGTEMTTMEADTAQWVSLVNAVRQVFKGQLTYSTNWDHHFPAFGSSLDFIAIDGWFPLKVAAGADPVPAVRSAWKPWLDQVHQDAVRLGKPAIFTELGIASQRGALTQPWAQLPNVPADNEVQRAYYAGTCAAVKGAVSGLYWWDFELNPPAANDNGFVPQGKPAESEVGRCFAQPGIPS
jgi:hypothetical protein